MQPVSSPVGQIFCFNGISDIGITEINILEYIFDNKINNIGYYCDWNENCFSNGINICLCENNINNEIICGMFDFCLLFFVFGSKMVECVFGHLVFVFNICKNSR